MVLTWLITTFLCILNIREKQIWGRGLWICHMQSGGRVRPQAETGLAVLARCWRKRKYIEADLRPEAKDDEFAQYITGGKRGRRPRRGWQCPLNYSKQIIYYRAAIRQELVAKWGYVQNGGAHVRTAYFPVWRRIDARHTIVQQLVEWPAINARAAQSVSTLNAAFTHQQSAWTHGTQFSEIR